jgi:hypothetical protein
MRSTINKAKVRLGQFFRFGWFAITAGMFLSGLLIDPAGRNHELGLLLSYLLFTAGSPMTYFFVAVLPQGFSTFSSGFVAWIFFVLAGYFQWFVLLPKCRSIAKDFALELISRVVGKGKEEKHGLGTPWGLLSRQRVLRIWILLNVCVLVWWSYQKLLREPAEDVDSITKFVMTGLGFPASVVIWWQTEAKLRENATEVTQFVCWYLPYAVLGYYQWFVWIPRGLSFLSRLAVCFIYRLVALIPRNRWGAKHQAAVSRCFRVIKIAWVCGSVVLGAFSLYLPSDKADILSALSAAGALSFPTGWVLAQGLRVLVDHLEEPGYFFFSLCAFPWVYFGSILTLLVGYWQWFVLVPRAMALRAARSEEG